MAISAFAVSDDWNGNAFIDSLLYGAWKWQSVFGPTAPTVVGVYFSDEGLAWATSEEWVFANALSKWSAVANISFDLVGRAADANLVEIKRPELVGVSGSHYTPMQAAGRDQVATGQYDWSESSYTSLSEGGQGFSNFVHEIGHALGLAHPHDREGGSLLFPGVTGEFDTGDHGLNQGVFTVMSYSTTWDGAREPENETYGRAAGPMAFDIAAIQHLYGANTDWATGNNTYVLPEFNGIGTAWRCIWDAGGTDQIVYDGWHDATIDLRAATLLNEIGGGGRPSFAENVSGGFTIANGVWIENATGGNGRDLIFGNDIGNTLNGRGEGDAIRGFGGNDKIIGDFGSDYLYGDAGDDTLYGGASKDRCWGGAGADDFYYTNVAESRPAYRDIIMDFQRGLDDIVLRSIDADAGMTGDQPFRFIGDRPVMPRAGELYIVPISDGSSTPNRVLVEGHVNGDGVVDLQIEVMFVSSLSWFDFVL